MRHGSHRPRVYSSRCVKKEFRGASSCNRVKLNNCSILRRCAHLFFFGNIFIYDYCSAYEVTSCHEAQWKRGFGFWCWALFRNLIASISSGREINRNGVFWYFNSSIIGARAQKFAFRLLHERCHIMAVPSHLYAISYFINPSSRPSISLEVSFYVEH